MEDKYTEIIRIIENEGYAAHDLDHVLRVYNLCEGLAQKEKDVDEKVLRPAALLHDIARSVEDNDTTGETDHALLGGTMAEQILENLNFPPRLIEQIKHCIVSHRYRSGYQPQTIEAKILFDADKLDSLGAVGVARSFMLAGEHGERLYQEYEEEEYKRFNTVEHGRIKDPSKHSSNLEFELKLMHIPERLFTKEAKRIAEARREFMKNFFVVLKAEIQGEK